jgi:hypothetical protein
VTEPLPVIEPNPLPPALSVAETTALINVFAGMLNSATQLIITRLDDNSRMASERWAKHDAELDRNREIVVARFLKIETALDAHLVVANAHFVREHDEDLVMDARVRPVRVSLAYVIAHWKTALLVILSVLGLMGIWLDVLRTAQF